MGQINTQHKLEIVYVLTSNGRDFYADMTLISALSVRHTNPGCRINVVCDRSTFDLISASKHSLLGECDTLTPISTPDGEPTFRNRWIKTQLGLFVKGPALFLDSDTLVRDSASELVNVVPVFGAVANHNGEDLSSQIWEEDLRQLQQLDWSGGQNNYLNGGVWFYNDARNVSEFFRIWHSLWKYGFLKTGRLRDQPSFNTALDQSGISLTLLNGNYNKQLDHCDWRNGEDARAKIWHFYASASMQATSFERLIYSARSTPLKRLRRDVALAIKCAAPWPNFDLLSRMVSNRIANHGNVTKTARLWLYGTRRRAVLSLFAKTATALA